MGLINLSGYKGKMHLQTFRQYYTVVVEIYQGLVLVGNGVGHLLVWATWWWNTLSLAGSGSHRHRFA
jgi:hypothetical protein